MTFQVSEQNRGEYEGWARLARDLPTLNDALPVALKYPPTNNRYPGVSLFQLMRERDLRELGFPFTGWSEHKRRLYMLRWLRHNN